MKFIFPRFEENIHRHSLVSAGDTIILGFSGGKDSVTLLLLFKELQKKISFELIAAYFNHRLRHDSDMEEQWINQFCKHHHIKLEKGSRHVREFKEKEKLNLEHAASISRYDFFHQVAALKPNARIATAHTRSDLSETFFIKLFRGSGLQGLSAIFQNKEKKLIRPLLIFSTEDILAFLKRNKIEYFDDYSNHDEAFLRNRIRQKLIQQIKMFEPHIEERIFRTTQILQNEFDFMQSEAKAVLGRSLILGNILPETVFPAIHPALQRHVAREYIRLLKGNLLNIRLEHIDTLIAPEKKRRGLSIPGLQLRTEKGFIFPEGIEIPPFHYMVKEPGVYPIPETGMMLIVKSVNQFIRPQSNDEITVPSAPLLFPLYLRSPQKGDRYKKINAPYAQNLMEIIRDSGFPATLRNLCPVLANGNGEIIWVRHSPIADPFKVKKNSTPPFVKFYFTPIINHQNSKPAEQKK